MKAKKKHNKNLIWYFIRHVHAHFVFIRVFTAQRERFCTKRSKNIAIIMLSSWSFQISNSHSQLPTSVSNEQPAAIKQKRLLNQETNDHVGLSCESKLCGA